MSQSDVVTLLRNVPLDSMVNLVVSRHAVDNGTDQQQVEKGPNINNNNKSLSGSGRKLQFQINNQLETNKDEVKTDEELMNQMPTAIFYCTVKNYNYLTVHSGIFL